MSDVNIMECCWRCFVRPTKSINTPDILPTRRNHVCCQKQFVHPATTINSPQRLVRVQNLRVPSKILCTPDYNNQFPTSPCASSESMGDFKDALYVQLQQPISLRVLLEMLYTYKYNIQILIVKEIHFFTHS